MSCDHKVITLQELNAMIREVIELEFSETYWVKAELSEVRLSSRGHCYLELVQNDRRSKTAIAKARAVVMSHIFPLLKLHFEETTGQTFRAGLEVLLEVRPSFSEIYGYSLIVEDIDPTFTIGDMALKRKEIMERLKKDGVADLQKELSLPYLLQRIAIISSSTAAGLEDFCHQLDSNEKGLRFDYKLFQATMQGTETEKTIIQALEQIAEEQDRWDVVVIIRGGGAVSDLNSFDSYELANNCAQFPLPIITGIGHQRDLTVLDMIAFQSLKTPTAVSDFLIWHMNTVAEKLETLETRMTDATRERIEAEKMIFSTIADKLNRLAQNFILTREGKLNILFERMARLALNRVTIERIKIEEKEKRLPEAISTRLQKEKHWQELIETRLKLVDPERILELGYSLTLKDGKIVKKASELKAGDVLKTKLADGEVESIVNKTLKI